MNMHIKTIIILLTFHTFGYAADGANPIKKPTQGLMERDPAKAQHLTTCEQLVIDTAATCCAYCAFSATECFCPCRLSGTEKTKKNT
jgi:hypothetical protein